MKLIFDFDGVMTDQTEEAHRVQDIFLQILKEKTAWPEARLNPLLQAAHAEMGKNPHNHGWIDGGRVSAFADEDIFMENVGLAFCLDGLLKSRDGDFALLREVLAGSDTPDVRSVAFTAYQVMIQETAQGKVKPVDPCMTPLFQKIVGLGHHITVVSNSSTARILDLLHKQGLKAADHDDDPQAPFKVRGQAGKFLLAAEPRPIAIAGYTVDTARPQYEKILREEKPRVVVGDVFSLDLALPFYLATHEPKDFGGMSIVLRRRHYTPPWVLDFFQSSKERNTTLHVIEALDEVFAIL